MTASVMEENCPLEHPVQPDFEVDAGTEGPDHQTKRSTEYTTENYKVELANLPNKLKFHVVKNILERQFKINPHKIRLGQGKAFITFKNQSERDDAIQKLNNQDWKGRTLSAHVAPPRDDLVAKRRKVEDGSSNGEKPAPDQRSDDTISDEDINNQVCPFFKTSYDDQIMFKDQLMRSILNMSRHVLKLAPNIKTDEPTLFDWAKKNHKICCQFDGVMRSPVLQGYRNKCEFNIGHDGEVGFKIGRYKNGSDRICRPPRDCPILTEKIHHILDVFREFLKDKSKLKGFDLVTHEGYYRQLTIRRNQKDEYLIIVDLHPQDLSKEDLEVEKKALANDLKEIDGVVSIFFNISDKSSFSSTNQSLELVYGSDSLVEELSVDPDRPLKFRIGPASFFQVNTKAAELLYRSVIELANLGPKSFVLDVGCGTGTIGLSLARQVNYVIGIEIVAEAVEDAKVNARNNGIENISFYAGKAEDLIGETLRIMRNKIEFQKLGEEAEIVAIVDPPRVGFNSSFIKTIRASNIQKLIYIACDPKANTNLLTLCRPRSKAYQGDPLVPVRAKAFDLFPYTKFCELVIVYERLSRVSKEDMKAESRPTENI